MMNNSKGLFITFEGGEGCGKSTQVERMAARLRASGKTVVTVREPGGTPIGEEIRHVLQYSQAGHAMVPEAEALLFAASRAQLVREVILPALSRGEVVICDRFADSTTVYQGVARKLDETSVAALNAFAIDDCRPDLTLLLDIDVRLGMERSQQRQLTFDRMQEQKMDFYERVRRGYRALAKKEPHRIKVIDATPSPDEVEARIWEEVRKLFAPRKTTRNARTRS
jgi:dTMP kinase